MKVDFSMDIGQVVFTEPVLYCDFATDNYEARPYVEVKDIAVVGFFSYLSCYSHVKCLHMYSIMYRAKIECFLTQSVQLTLWNVQLTCLECVH